MGSKRSRALEQLMVLHREHIVVTCTREQIGQEMSLVVFHTLRGSHRGRFSCIDVANDDIKLVPEEVVATAAG